MRLSELADGDGGISPSLSGYEAVLCFVMEIPERSFSPAKLSLHLFFLKNILFGCTRS